MATHRRNWNTDFQNLANDMFYSKKEMSYEDLEELYFELVSEANDEILELKREIGYLQTDLYDLQSAHDILENENIRLEEKLQEWENKE